MKLVRQMISLILVLAMLCSFLPAAVLDTSAEEMTDTVAVESIPTEMVVIDSSCEELSVEGGISEETDMQEDINLQFTHINPRYAGYITEGDLRYSSLKRIQTFAQSEYVTSPEKAGDIFRQQMKERQETIAFNIDVDHADESYLRSLCQDICDIAIH